MKKIPTLFERDLEDRAHVTRNVTPGCEWVIDGEGTPTVKHDGTCCLIDGGVYYKRYEVKPGGKRPHLFLPAAEPDPHTGKQPGWVPVGDGPEDKWHREAYDQSLPPGTYELMGPKVQGNREGRSRHVLVPHGGTHLPNDTPRDYDGIRDWLKDRPHLEGIVWHHPDGRMVKIKGKDFR